MIISYTQTRRLKENTIPTLHILQSNISDPSTSYDTPNILIDNLNTNHNVSNILASLETSENCESNSDFVPLSRIIEETQDLN